jgi:hypothetical protein
MIFHTNFCIKRIDMSTQIATLLQRVCGGGVVFQSHAAAGQMLLLRQRTALFSRATRFAKNDYYVILPTQNPLL